MTASLPEHPLMALEEADRELVLRLVLASGSLKELARSYGVSYPTIRSRLDRVIARLRDLVEARPRDALTELLQALVARGEIGTGTARAIRRAHEDAMSKETET